MDGLGFGTVVSYAGTGTAIALTLALILVAIKTRSWHSVRYRLWLFANGKNKVTDDLVRETLEEETNLTAFRFFSMDADSIYEARELIEWGRSKRVSMGMLRACGDYFLRKELAVRSKLPSLKLRVVILGILSILAALLITISLMGTLTSSAILRFRDSGQWFLLSTNDARTVLRHNPVPITQTSCKDSHNHPLSSFSAEDGASICQIFEDPTLDKYVTDAVQQQRLAFALLIVMVLVLWVQLYRSVLMLQAAWKLTKHLEDFKVESPVAP